MVTQAIAPLTGPPALARLGQATRMLAEMRDITEAARVYAETARLGPKPSNHATEIKLRAERRAGELLRTIPREPRLGAGRPGRARVPFTPKSAGSVSESEEISSQAGMEFPSRGGGLTIIDTGLEGSAEAILGAVGAIGRRPDDVKEILLSHFHRDHVGSAAELAQRTGARVLAHPADARSSVASSAAPHPS